MIRWDLSELHDTAIAKLDDGRELCYAETGAANGYPVFVFHGLPGTRLQRHPNPQIARDLNLRLITVDRPGFGCSSPSADRTIGSWPEDVRQLADLLGLGRFSVAGWSGGGPYTLACAAGLGERVDRVAVASSLAPLDCQGGTCGMSLVNRILFNLAYFVPALATYPIRLMSSLAASNGEARLDALAAALGEPDRELFQHPDLRQMLLDDLHECLAQGPGATETEVRLAAQPWDFDLHAIEVPVQLWHARDDAMVPVHMGEYLAEQIPTCEATFFDEGGHFVVFRKWREFFELVAPRARRRDAKQHTRPR